MALTLDAFHSRFLLQQPQCNSQPLAGRHAAVLVPIVARPEPGLLLIQRSACSA